jgi:hypothetical protein
MLKALALLRQGTVLLSIRGLTAPPQVTPLQCSGSLSGIKSITLDDPPTGYASGDYQDVTHTGISDPYYILTPSSYWLRGEYNPAPPSITSFALWMIGIKKLSSTSVRVGWFCFGSYGIGGDVHENAGNNPTMKLLVCEP